MTTPIAHRRRDFAWAAACLAVGALVLAFVVPVVSKEAAREEPSPIFGVTLPGGYRQWDLIAPAEEAAPLDELRVVLGNRTAVNAYQKKTLPFPDGTVLVKLAWKRVPSMEFAPATVPGAATTVQVMVKNSRRYAATGGWGFGRFVNGKAASEAEHRTCFSCHAARVKQRDFVFTQLAH